MLTDVKRRVLVKVPQDPGLATWEPGLQQPPLFRPDLPELGDGRMVGYRTVVEASGASLSQPLGFVDADGISDEDLIGACEMGTPVSFFGASRRPD